MKKTVRTIEVSWESESQVVATRRRTVINGHHIADEPAGYDTNSIADIHDVAGSASGRAEIDQGGKDEQD